MPSRQSVVSSLLFFWSAILVLTTLFQLPRLKSNTICPQTVRLPEHLGSESIGDFRARLDSLSIEIFAVLQPFTSDAKERNEEAIKSWLRLKPQPKITLLGNQTGYEEAAEEFRLGIKSIDTNFLGVPMFNAMVQRANESTAMVTALVTGDVLLFDDFIKTISKALSSYESFLVGGARRDVDSLPEPAGDSEPDYARKVREHVLATGSLQADGGFDVWAWNTKAARLFDPVMPHFLLGGGKHDDWFMRETAAAKRRIVVNVSETCLPVRVRREELIDETAKFAQAMNANLSRSVNRSIIEPDEAIAPWKFSECYEPSGLCLMKGEQPEQNASVVALSVPQDDAEDGGSDWEPTMTSVIEKVVINNTIMLSALNYGYRGFMMNFVCNMRHLGVTNFVIASLDPELFDFAYTRGVPTYHETSIFSGLDTNILNHAKYGTDSFKQLTKMKSRVVVRILREGYNVIWTDCDIIYFRNPIRDMWAYNVDLAIQTDAPDGIPMNGVKRINSGLYLARSSEPMIHAFETIIRVAAKSRASEQPCFSWVLCGKKGERAIGTDTCKYKDVVVKMLDRHKYPNGVTSHIWDSRPGQIRRKFPDIFVLHNNWIVGADAKRERFEKHGFILYDNKTELCSYPPGW